MSRSFSIFPVVLSLIVLAACATESEDDLGTEGIAKGGCPLWGCDLNSPVMGPFRFHELHENGLYNTANVRVISLRKGADTYVPDVTGSSLVARNAAGVAVLTGTQLAGAYFELQTPSGIYKMYIDQVSNAVTYWVGPATAMYTYELTYEAPGTTFRQPVCFNPPERISGEGPLWSKRFEAILFTGDRYHATYKTVTASTPTTSGAWFNIGCAGSALAKLHLNRHTSAGSISTYQTTAGERQAMLKMYVSDVCGGGEEFTLQGTPLHWSNIKNWRTLTGLEPTFEAYWNASGAMCLEHHRLESDPAYAAEIEAMCPGKPLCSTLWPSTPNGWPAGAYIKTANP